MTSKTLLEASLFFQTGMSLTVLAIMLFRRASRVFPQLSILLGLNGVEVAISLGLLYFRQALHLPKETAYTTLFFATWMHLQKQLSSRFTS